MVVEEVYYQEFYCLQFYFFLDSMWMNDFNGMVYYEGEYYLFYQYYFDSIVWGFMYWGYVVSKDFIYWEYFFIVLYLDSLGYIFFGSVVIDWNNMSGLGELGWLLMIVIFIYYDLVGVDVGIYDYQY